MIIGILAVQGDFERHRQRVTMLEGEPLLVKTHRELQRCDGLIIPGGESTTFSLLLLKHGLWDDLKRYARHSPVFGTCAGLILMAKGVLGEALDTLAVIDIIVERNAYGRQVDSFIDNVHCVIKNESFDFEGVFIRAPKIKKLGKGVRALAWHGEEVVMAESKNILVATFHPELTDDLAIHRYFFEKVARSLSRVQSNRAY